MVQLAHSTALHHTSKMVSLPDLTSMLLRRPRVQQHHGSSTGVKQVCACGCAGEYTVCAVRGFREN